MRKLRFSKTNSPKIRRLTTRSSLIQKPVFLLLFLVQHPPIPQGRAWTKERGLAPAKPGAVICLPVSHLYLGLPSVPLAAKCLPEGVLIVCSPGTHVHQHPALSKRLLGKPEARVVLGKRGQTRLCIPSCQHGSNGDVPSFLGDS